MKILCSLILIAVITGCSTFTSPARYHELDKAKSYWMDYDATRRGTIVANESSKWKVCAEPSPDAAISMVAKLDLDLEVADKGKAGAKGELAQNIVNLAEKTQMVLFLRESLFRLCELSLNTGLDAEQSKELYQAIIDAALKLVDKDIAEVQLEQSRLESANQAQRVYQFLYERNVDPDVIQELLKDF